MIMREEGQRMIIDVVTMLAELKKGDLINKSYQIPIMNFELKNKVER